MRLKHRLKNYCLIMVADTLADLAGIVQQVRSQSEAPATREGVGSGQVSVQARPRGSRVSRTDGGGGRHVRTARARASRAFEETAS